MTSRERIVGQVGVEAADLLTRVERLLARALPEVRHQLVQAVHTRVAQLEDPLHGAEAARAVLWALYPYDDPPETFWASDAGQACARAIGHHRVVCSVRQAAWVLNVSRQRVNQLIEAGRLTRAEEGGVVSTSLLEELRGRGRRRG